MLDLYIYQTKSRLQLADLVFIHCPFVLYFQLRLRKITPKILQLLTEWTETFPYDFRDERMMRSLKELTHRLASGDEVSTLPLNLPNFLPAKPSFLDNIVH